MRFIQIIFASRQIPLLIISYASLSIFGCTNKAVNESQYANKVIYDLIEADNNSDIKSVLNSYTDSVEFYPAGKEFTRGIKNVQENYEKLFKENKLSITTEILETRIVGDNAIITGLNRGVRKTTNDSSVVKIDDKYIAILVRNKKGEWKIDKLIWGINH